MAVESDLYAEKQDHLYLVSDIDISKVNVIVTVGGDGTILCAQKYYKYWCIPPIIAFHLVIPFCLRTGRGHTRTLATSVRLTTRKSSPKLSRLEARRN